jgi:hypothetical protein
MLRRYAIVSGRCATARRRDGSGPLAVVLLTELLPFLEGFEDFRRKPLDNRFKLWDTKTTAGEASRETGQSRAVSTLTTESCTNRYLLQFC